MLVMQLLMATAIILNVAVVQVHFQSLHAWRVPGGVREFFLNKIGPWIKMSKNTEICKKNQLRVSKDRYARAICAQIGQAIHS